MLMGFMQCHLRSDIESRSKKLFSVSAIICSLIFSDCAIAQFVAVEPLGQYQSAASVKYEVLKNIPTRYERYNLEPWNLLKLPDFRAAYWSALKPIRKLRLTPYVKKLEVVWSPALNVACNTPLGVAMIYSGSKPKWATDSIRIVFFPDSKKISIRVTDEFVKYQNGDFGSLDDIALKILDGNACNLGEIYAASAE